MNDNSPLSWLELISIVASFVSVIIGIFAIWLSVVFYRFSNESSTHAKDSADKISSSVTRLESLFDKLYSDTFTIMRDTVTDMRKHAWGDTSNGPASQPVEVQHLIDEKVTNIQEQVQREIANIISRQSSTDAKVLELGGQLQDVVARAITESSQVDIEARQEIIEQGIISIVSNAGALQAYAITGALEKMRSIPPPETIQAIRKLVREGRLEANSSRLDAGTTISLPVLRPVSSGGGGPVNSQ
jgi:hypothetical protein